MEKKRNEIARRVSFNAKKFKELGEAGRRIDIEATIEKRIKIDLLLACKISAAFTHGDDLGWIPQFKRQCFVKIAEGSILPEIFDMYLTTNAGRKIYALPVSEQQAFVDGKKVQVYSFENGKDDYREVNPYELTNMELSQVFDRDGVRSAAAQRSWFETQKKKKAMKEVIDDSDSNIQWEIDKRNKVVIGRLDGKIVARIKPTDLSGWYVKLTS